MNDVQNSELESELLELDKIPLSVPLIVNALNVGKKQADIARMCGVSEQAVSDYKQRHISEIGLALDKSDASQAIMHRINIARASEKLHTALDFTATKKDIIPLVAVIDRLTPALRLLEGKSTSNISAIASIIEAVHSEKQDDVTPDNADTLTPIETTTP